MYSYQEKLIIKYLWIKHKYGAARIVNDHPEYEWDMNGVKKPLKRLTRLVTLLRIKIYDGISHNSQNRTIT